MIDCNKLLRFLPVLALSCLPAQGYGIAINSTTGANVDSTFKQYEISCLDKLAAATQEVKVPPTASCEVIIDENGKVVDAYFRPQVPPEPGASETLNILKRLTFGSIPNIEKGAITITFNFTELQTKPYRMNSLRISSGGSIRAGDIDASGKPKTMIGPGPPRTAGNRITGPFELGPPLHMSEANKARLERHRQLRQLQQGGIDGITDLRLLNDMLSQALARRKFDEAIKIQRRIIALARSDKSQPKELLVKSSLKLAIVAVDAEQIPVAKEAFADALRTIDEGGDASATESTISSLAILSSKMTARSLLDTADSGIRKAIELDAVRSREGKTFPRVSLAFPVKLLVDSYVRKSDYDSAISLQRFRLAKCKEAESANTAAIVVCQMDLASTLLAAGKNGSRKSKLLEESNQVFDEVQASTLKTFGRDSHEYIDAVNRRVNDLTSAGEIDAAQKLRKKLTAQ